VGVFLLLVGFLVNAICGVIILIKAFRVSTGWGLAVLFLPFAGLFFVLNHWEDTKKPFLGSIAGVVLIFMGAFIAPEPDRADDAPETRSASRSTQPEPPENAPQANYASAAAAPAVAYEPPKTYTPAYNPPQQAAPPVVTDTQAVEDEWSRKPALEQVYVDRTTNTFYAEKCRKRPENAYRIPKSVALMQGITEAKCR
jgi:hypothetical protein